MAEPVIDVRGLSVGYGQQLILAQFDWQVLPGQLMAIVGPNGSGKSTLLKSVLGLIPIQSGSIKLFNQPAATQRTKVAYVPQRTTVDWDFPTTVFDVVLMGTYGRLKWYQRPGTTELSCAQDAIERVGLADFRARQISQLSGGQQQRVFLARALAQQADLYLMDEPFQGVDANTEAAMVAVLQGLRDAGKTIVVVHHDLSTITEYFDTVTMINRKLIAQGPALGTFNPDTIQRTYSK